ncbi:MAG: 2-oxo acid dehydrogenase subunit E2 [Micrococcales bacterium]|nr:2-oxo acid dehydrogenase subunit E2 [Micrococcales bacterium]
MAIQTFRLPDPGEGLVEADIIEWKVGPGDSVTVNQIILEIETSKSLVELPSPWAGTVKELLVEPGATVEVGTPIITIDDGQGGGPTAAEDGSADAASGEHADATGEGWGDTSGGPREKSAAEAAGGDKSENAASQATLVGYGDRGGSKTTRRARKSRAPQGDRPVRSIVQTSFDPELAAVEPEHPGRVAMWERAAVAEATDPARHPAPVARPEEPAEGERPRAKPPVRKYAKDRGVDLGQVSATGPDGTVTRGDVDAFIAQQSAPQASGAQGGSAAYAMDRGETRTPVKGVRKATAQAMVGSAFTAPHVTEWITVDVTRTMELVERLKSHREFRGAKVTPMLLLAKALCLAIKRNPGVNAAWDEQAQEIVEKHYVNLGIAAATPRGLMVPNIKDADLLSLRELADAIAALTETAREGRTQPADMSQGTITITNVGVFGVDAGTPIINPGESAILCFGAVRRQPWVVTAGDGTESIEPRWVTQLALSFDHRLVDGELGSKVLADIAAVMEDPGTALLWA